MSYKILLGVTGSIAAYKIIDLAKTFIQPGYDVTIVLSKSAPQFISVLTLRSIFPNKVFCDTDILDSNDQMLHISLAKAADLIVIAPASANFIAKLAHANADCLLSTICIATESKIIVAPAMNKVMWGNNIVQKNINILKEFGIQILGPVYGQQACGDFGLGRMIDPEDIVKFCQDSIQPQLLQGKKVIITAGPTREKIDPVRFLSNYSSGKMGYALAESAHAMGAEVVLISGPTALVKPPHVNIVEVESSEEMLTAAIKVIKDADVFIGCAAVADYRPENYSSHKIKKKKENFTLRLIKNTDIISHIKSLYPHIFCLGFAAETSDHEKYGISKIKEKNLDMIAINDVSDGKVFGLDFNQLHVILKDHQHYILQRNTKSIIAYNLLKLLVKYLP